MSEGNFVCVRACACVCSRVEGGGGVGEEDEVQMTESERGGGGGAGVIQGKGGRELRAAPWAVLTNLAEEKVADKGTHCDGVSVRGGLELLQTQRRRGGGNQARERDAPKKLRESVRCCALDPTVLDLEGGLEENGGRCKEGGRRFTTKGGRGKRDSAAAAAAAVAGTRLVVFDVLLHPAPDLLGVTDVAEVEEPNLHKQRSQGAKKGRGR